MYNDMTKPIVEGKVVIQMAKKIAKNKANKKAKKMVAKKAAKTKVAKKAAKKKVV